MSYRFKSNKELNQDKRNFQQVGATQGPFYFHPSSFQNFQQNINTFNSIRRINNESFSSNSIAQQSSDNETQNFIRTQFVGIPIKKQENFKLFKLQVKQKQFKKTRNFNQKVEQQQISNNKVNDRAFFQIQLQDQEDKNIEKKILNQIEFGIQRLTHQPNLCQKTQITDKLQKKTLKLYSYSQIEALENIMMKRMKQKQNQISFLEKVIEDQNEQKFYQFRTNQQLQKQLMQLREQVNIRQKIDYSNIISSEWRPSNIQQIKLAHQHERLKQQLQSLDRQQIDFQKVVKTLLKQEILLKGCLKNTLKTRKQYIKCLTKNQVKRQDNLQKQYIDKATRCLQTSNTYKQKSIIPRQFDDQNEKLQNFDRLDNSKKSNSILQISSIKPQDQRQMLLQLYSEFTKLKNKVNESLSINKQIKFVKKGQVSRLRNTKKQ